MVTHEDHLYSWYKLLVNCSLSKTYNLSLNSYSALIPYLLKGNMQQPQTQMNKLLSSTFFAILLISFISLQIMDEIRPLLSNL